MDQPRLGRGELLLKYVAVWEWSFFAGTIFVIVVLWYASYLFGWMNASFNHVLAAFLALAVLEAIIASYRIWKRNQIIAAGNLSSAKPPINKEPISADEKLLAVIPSAMESRFILYRYFDFRSIGPAIRPQNVLIITDKHLIFVYAPLFLGDQVMGSCFVGGSNWKWANKEIEQSINNLLSTMSIKGVYESYSGNFSLSLDGIKSIRLSDWRQMLTVNTNFKKSFSLMIKMNDDYSNAKKTLTELGLVK